MSKWVVPNTGPVLLILDTSEAKRNLLEALDAAGKAGKLSGELARFAVLLDSEIRLEDELAKVAA